MSEKSDKLRAMLAKEKERRIKLNNRIEILERRIQEEDSAEVNEMVRTAKVTPEQLAALLRQSATATPNPAALSAGKGIHGLAGGLPCGRQHAASMTTPASPNQFLCFLVFRHSLFCFWRTATAQLFRLL